MPACFAAIPLVEDAPAGLIPVSAGLWVGGGVVACVLLLLATGGWRAVCCWPWRLSPAQLGVAHLGLDVAAADRPRIDGVLAGFARGFNAALLSRTERGWARRIERLEPFVRPFAQEGAAMAFVPRRGMRYDAATFERRHPHTHPAFRYLHYVGLGFWAGMRQYSPDRLTRMTEPLDPLYRFLCYDGFGFQHAFFDWPRDPQGLAPLDQLTGYARHAAYQGVGRALVFYHLADVDALIARAASVGPHAPDVAGGLGLAAVFLFPDRLAFAQELGRQVPSDWQRSFQVGACFGLKARAAADPVLFADHLAAAPPSVADAVRSAVAACDDLETQVRQAGLPDGYRRWREALADWMTEHLEYPFAGRRHR